MPGFSHPFYGVLVPSDAKWTVLMAWQGRSGGPLYKLGKSGEIDLPKQAFSVLPISDVFERVNKAVAILLGGGGTKK